MAVVLRLAAGHFDDMAARSRAGESGPAQEPASQHSDWARFCRITAAVPHDCDENAAWLQLAHVACAKAGIRAGHIVDRLSQLCEQLPAQDTTQGVARHVAAIPSKEALTDLIAQGLNGTYHCTRVWSAWGVGTMSENDFAPVDESETPGELADAVLAMLAEQQPLARAQAEPVAVVGDAYSLLWAFTGAFPDFAKRHDLKVGTTLYAHPAPQPTELVNSLLGVIRGAEKWIRLSDHGENCFVSDHYEGDPGDRCNCGRDELLSAIQTAIDKATDTESGAA